MFLTIRKASIETEINQTRLAINGYLDKLEKELLTKLQEASDSVKDQIMELVAEMFEGLSRVILYFVNCPGIQGFLFLFLPR
jgi:hypothetical protein